MTGRRVTKPRNGLQAALADAVVKSLAASGTSQQEFAAILGLSPKHRAGSSPHAGGSDV